MERNTRWMRPATASLFAGILALLLLNGCSTGGDTAESTGSVEFDAKTDRIIIEMQDGGIIKLELYPEHAPITVDNFVRLVDQGFYDGLIFHRVIEGFMIQGGDPQGTGMGGSGRTIKGEFSANGVDNPIPHDRGVISMARSKAYNSASSQFFIVHQAANGLDGSYAAFGKVVEGMDIVDRIASVECGADDNPLNPQVIKEIRIG